MKTPGRRSWRTVSLRTLLLTMLACGCMLGLLGREQRQAKRRAEIVQELSQAASKIELESVNLWGRKTSGRPPQWLGSMLGEACFQHVTGVTIERADLLPPDGGLLGELRHLRSLNYDGGIYWTGYRWLRSKSGQSPYYVGSPSGTSFTDHQAAGMKRLRRLENVSLRGASLTDSGLECISPRNPLQSLDVSFTEITDRGAAHIARFKTLEILDVSNTWITDEGLHHIARAPNLKNLTLSGMMVSDVGLRVLSQSSSLEQLTIARLAVSLDGLFELTRLPNLTSVNLGGLSLSRGDILSLHESSLSNPFTDAESPSAFWALDQEVAPRGARYVRWLLEHGADPNRPQNIGGVSPLAAFVVQNDREAVEVLRAHSADVNQHDDGGRTPLSMAAERGQLGMMEFLLARGAAPHPMGAQSAVCSAAATGQLEAIKLLVEHGANVNRPNHHGHTPLEAAVHHPRAYELLVKLGAEFPHGRSVSRPRPEPPLRRQSLTPDQPLPQLPRS